MRRPLFWVCIALSVIAVLQMVLSGTADREGIRRAVFSGDSPGENEILCISGRVCGKGTIGQKEYFLLQINFLSDQSAATSRQIISCLRQMKTTKVRCSLAGGPGEALPKMGSEVLVEGRFSFFEEATNPGEFNFAGYYHGQGIGGALSEARVLWQSKSHSLIREGLCALRAYFGRRLDAIFPPKEAGVMKTMLLGDRSDLDPTLKELYRNGGILHVLSISGLHVTLLGMGLYRLLCRVGVQTRFSAVCGGAVLVLYGLMTGMSVSAVRAIGMFLLRMLASLWGRTYDMLTATGLMAALMLCTQPVYGLYSGFWLSFGAILGMGGVLPVLEALVAGRLGTIRPGEGRVAVLLRKTGRALEESLLAGCAVFLTSLPLLLYFYYEVPTYSMLMNLLVIPAMGPMVLFGFAAMLIPGLGVLGTVDVVLLKVFEGLCEVAQKLPFPSWNPGCPAIWQMAVYYGSLTGGLALLWKWKETREQPGRVPRRMRWIILLCPIFIFAIPIHAMTGVVFLDVGQGDCACIRLKDGQTWIYDCGSSSKKEVGKNILIPYLKHEGIRHIDGVILSHGDKDHASGMQELFQLASQEGIEIDHVFFPDIGMDRVREEFAELFKAAELVPKAEIHFLKAGDQLRGEAFSLLTLHPGGKEEDLKRMDGNEASLCLLAKLQGRGGELTVLLTGDVEGKGEERLLQEMTAAGVNQVNVLKCAHHGSKNATSDAFLGLLDADVAVISCGRKNRYGHPHEELLERLEEDGTAIFRTDQGGAVTVRVQSEKVVVEGF